MLGISLLFIFLVAKGFIKKQGHYNSPYLLIFLIFPIITLFAYINQRQLLKLKQINTDFLKPDNYKIVKDTLHTLNWRIKVDNKGFIEAYTNNFVFWTWTDQMISIVITDNKILFNSIGNVDTYATQLFSWGQNTRNIKQFKSMFELLETKHSS